MDIRRYFFAWDLDEDFIERIETFAVWSNTHDRDPKTKSKQNGLFITKDNEVYGVGELINKCYLSSTQPDPSVGIDKSWGLCKPVLLEKLSHKRIKKFTITFHHVFICTEEGEVLGYGRYKYKKHVGYNLPNAVAQLTGIHVVDIAAAAWDDSLLVLDKDGQVYHWVLRQSRFFLFNIILSAWQSKPLSVLSGSRVFHFFAVLENGKVLKVTRHQQELMHFRDPAEDAECKIVKMVCGHSHALLLDKYGRLFVTGSNLDGQLGIGEVKGRAEKLEQNLFFTEKIVDIAANPSCSMSAVITETGKVYMFGNCRGIGIFKPILTSCSSLQEVFYHYSAPLVTYKPMKTTELGAVVHKPKPPVEITNEIKQINNHSQCEIKTEQNTLKDSSENGCRDFVCSVDNFSDLSLAFEGKLIPVHKTVLALRSEHFAEMFQENSTEEIPNVLEIEADDFKSYVAFLKYIYTDKMEKMLSADEITGLFNLANKYRLKTLAERCSSLMQLNITIENVISLYESVAVMSEDEKLKQESKDLKEMCIIFTMKNEMAVIKSEEFKKMDSDMAKSLIMEVFERRSA